MLGSQIFLSNVRLLDYWHESLKEKVHNSFVQIFMIEVYYELGIMVSAHPIVMGGPENFQPNYHGGSFPVPPLNGGT